MERNDLFKEITNSILTDSLRAKIQNKISLESYRADALNYTMNNSSSRSTVLEAKDLREKFKQLFNKRNLFSESIGTHPDFIEIGNNRIEQYIVSVFIDIKGSTKLATIKGLSLEEVREIKNRILTIAIAIFQVFDGHIHRLQGDALFAYFGNKTKNKSDSIIDSLNAVTVLNYTFTEYISKLFEEMEWPKIKIRAGIDFGDDNQVLWSKYGIGGCTEITTTSIHTDLAAKLQNKAKSNGVMIGNNVKEYLDIPEEFYSVKTKQENNKVVEEKYILEHSEFKYKMWDFNWQKYLTRFNQFTHKNLLPVKILEYIEGQDYIVKCFYKEENTEEWKSYERNSCSIPKKSKLKFNLNIIDKTINFLGKKIEWEVNNRGKEAEENGKLKFIDKTSIDGDFECSQSTAYKGHHYMRILIRGEGNHLIGESYFGIYVRD